MATKFLRKIILEELKKVLKEVDYPDIPGSQPGQTYTPDPKMTRPGKSVYDPGPCTKPGDPGCIDTGSDTSAKKVGACGAGYDPRCQPKILKLQKELNYFAKTTKNPKIKEDGILGKDTNILFKKVTGVELSYANLKDPVKYRSMMTSLRDYTNKIMASQIAQLEKERDEIGIPAKAGVKSKTQAPEGAAGAFFDAEGNPIKLFPDESDKPVNPNTFGGQEESLIRREITKLLKNL